MSLGKLPRLLYGTKGSAARGSFAICSIQLGILLWCRLLAIPHITENTWIVAPKQKQEPVGSAKRKSVSRKERGGSESAPERKLRAAIKAIKEAEKEIRAALKAAEKAKSQELKQRKSAAKASAELAATKKAAKKAAKTFIHARKAASKKSSGRRAFAWKSGRGGTSGTGPRYQ